MFFDRAETVRPSTWDFWQTMIGLVVGVAAIIIASRQYLFSVWLLKLDTVKFKIEGLRDDLNRMMSQYDMMRTHKDDIEDSDTVLTKTDKMIGLARESIKSSLSEYHGILDNNPMGFGTKGLNTISSNEHTLEEISKMTVK